MEAKQLCWQELSPSPSYVNQSKKFNKIQNFLISNLRNKTEYKMNLNKFNKKFANCPFSIYIYILVQQTKPHKNLPGCLIEKPHFQWYKLILF
jgi:hypothetical protein